MNIIGRRRTWYAISLIGIVPGLISLFMYGLQLGIDFKGGSLLEVEGTVSQDKVRELAEPLELKDIIFNTGGDGRTLIRFRDDAADPAKREQNHQELKAKLAAENVTEVRFDTVGPSVSRDITRNAILSVLMAALAIVLYISWAFRKTPPPVTSWSFGVCAVIALLHDALFVLGVFSLLGHFFGVEVDALFVTALLTVIGFSVHDTIVVFDRIRENLRRERKTFEVIVNDSILETLARSINTSVTVLLTLLALFLFGGQSIRYFVLALLIGIVSGTYSSIFNASQLLVSWHNFKLSRLEKASKKKK